MYTRPGGHQFAGSRSAGWWTPGRVILMGDDGFNISHIRLLAYDCVANDAQPIWSRLLVSFYVQDYATCLYQSKETSV
jgi:hypothetical protein